MNTLKQTFIFFTTIILLTNCESKTDKPELNSNTDKSKKEVLLIGTFHYHNPGADIAKTKTFDILNKDSQSQLEMIAEKIQDFGSTKIFVEWPFNEQKELDSLYSLYKENKYFDNDSLSNFYQKNEIFQLAFRASLKSKLNGVIAIDYLETQFPFDSLMTVIALNSQTNLKTEIENGIKHFTSDFDSKIERGSSLLDLTYYLNSSDMRKKSNKFHTQIPLLAGEKENFIGAFLTSEWYKRNLYMWSLVQKSLEEDDNKIVLLLGASHIATIKDYIDNNEAWKVVELQEIMD